ncbi:MAG TPA: hypothetical protein VMT37_01470 [Solirubrobacterales bacterium]|nr:hypothetical protein [Solirubrobacterales bacterium]
MTGTPVLGLTAVLSEGGELAAVAIAAPDLGLFESALAGGAGVGTPAAQVDEGLAAWLAEQNAAEQAFACVGWSIGPRALPAVQAALPRCAGRFASRAIELEVVCEALGGALPHRDQVLSAGAWEQRARAAAASALAEYAVDDAPTSVAGSARAAILAWLWLRRSISSGGHA